MFILCLRFHLPYPLIRSKATCRKPSPLSQTRIFHLCRNYEVRADTWKLRLFSATCVLENHSAAPALLLGAHFQHGQFGRKILTLLLTFYSSNASHDSSDRKSITAALKSLGSTGLR